MLSTSLIYYLFDKKQHLCDKNTLTRQRLLEYCCNALTVFHVIKHFEENTNMWV